MTTWKLTLTPPEGPITQKTGLTHDETLVALADLMYGRFDDVAETPAEAPREEITPLAA
jgi:hypothetical protein